jgi:hypothetical protein
VSFEVVRVYDFRAKGPIICIAQATGLGDTKTRNELGLKARPIAKRSGLQPEGDCFLPSPSPLGWAKQTKRALPLKQHKPEAIDFWF